MNDVDGTEESNATSTSIPTHLLGNSQEDSSRISLDFADFPVTPSLEDVREELQGTKNEPLSNVIVSHLPN